MVQKVHTLNENYQKLDPKAKTAMRVRYFLMFIIWLIVAAIFYVLIKDDSFADFYLYGIVGISVIFAIIVIAFPKIYYDHYRYKITSDEIDIRKGIIILRHIVVPIERVHQVEVSRGPITSMFGLSHVIITTAGGIETVDYLVTDVAETIIEELKEIVNKIVRERN